VGAKNAARFENIGILCTLTLFHVASLLSASMSSLSLSSNLQSKQSLSELSIPLPEYKMSSTATQSCLTDTISDPSNNVGFKFLSTSTRKANYTKQDSPAMKLADLDHAEIEALEMENEYSRTVMRLIGNNTTNVHAR